VSRALSGIADPHRGSRIRSVPFTLSTTHILPQRGHGSVYPCSLGFAENGARGRAPIMGQGTGPLWVGRAKPCPCGAHNLDLFVGQN